MEESRSRLWDFLGELPHSYGEMRGPTNSSFLERELDRPLWGCKEQHWLLDLNGEQMVPAVLLVPQFQDEDAGSQIESHKFPLIIYNHALGPDHSFGKRELTENRPSASPSLPPYGHTLPKLGFMVLCIDNWTFGKRHGSPIDNMGGAERDENEETTFKRFLLHGRTIFGSMVYDTIRAVDWVCTLPNADSSKIITMGFSAITWFHAALDIRVGCCVDICCMTDFHSLLDRSISQEGIKAHGLHFFLPGLLNKRSGFSTEQIISLITPRPHFCLTGKYDTLTPFPALVKIRESISIQYNAAGADANWMMIIDENTGHWETEQFRNTVQEWLLSFRDLTDGSNMQLDSQISAHSSPILTDASTEKEIPPQAAAAVNDTINEDYLCPVCLTNQVLVNKTINGTERLEPYEACTCANGHSICLTCCSSIVFESTLSPTKMKYDCPICRTGCVINVPHALALMKKTYLWRIDPDNPAIEGLRGVHNHLHNL